MSLARRLVLRTHPLPLLGKSSLPLHRPVYRLAAFARAPTIRTMTSQSTIPSTVALETLLRYTACDVADALLKLDVPNAGYLPDLTLHAPRPATSFGQVTIAPASTVLFVSKGEDVPSHYPAANIPTGTHWVDATQAETIVVMRQPDSQKCAVLGGIMALRMKVLNAKGVVVSGRVRDVVELGESGLLVSKFVLICKCCLVGLNAWHVSTRRHFASVAISARCTLMMAALDGSFGPVQLLYPSCMWETSADMTN